MTIEHKDWMLIHKVVYYLWKQGWTLLKEYQKRRDFRRKCLNINLEFFVPYALQARGSDWEDFLRMIRNLFFMEENDGDMIKIVE